MTRNLRLWQRDTDVLAAVSRSPLLTNQVARLFGFPSPKKAAERLCSLYRAGLIKRVPYFQQAMQGKPEFVYYHGARPQPRTLTHTIAIAEVHVLFGVWLRSSPELRGEFLYGYERPTSTGILPDATILVRTALRTGLVFVEVDLGTESVNSGTGYSLAHKLSAYASYFDSGAYQEDVPGVRGFRVALIVPQGRLRTIQQLVAREHHDFVLTSTPGLLAGGWHRSVWSTFDGQTVDFLGRAGGELVGELVKPLLPVDGGVRS